MAAEEAVSIFESHLNPVVACRAKTGKSYNWNLINNKGSESLLDCAFLFLLSHCTESLNHSAEENHKSIHGAL